MEVEQLLVNFSLRMKKKFDVFFFPFPPPPSLPPLISLDGFFLAGFQLSGPESLLALEQVNHVGARFRRFRR